MALSSSSCCFAHSLSSPQLLKQHSQEVQCRSSWQCARYGSCQCVDAQPVLPYVELAFELGLPVAVQDYRDRAELECALFTFRYIPALSPQVARQVDPLVCCSLSIYPSLLILRAQAPKSEFAADGELHDTWFRWRPHTHRYHGPRVKARVCTIVTLWLSSLAHLSHHSACRSSVHF
jgi:hypothetical protein